MFGTYRLLLALTVLFKHFKETEVFSGFAVWSFFLLSGFLITNALNKRYLFGWSGLIEFAINRALRVYPMYWISVALAFLSIVLFGHLVDPRSINSAFGIPQSGLEWISTMFIFGGTFLGLGRLDTSLSPSSWAVDVEILMYACSALWLSRRPRNAYSALLFCLGCFPVLYIISKLLMLNGYPELAGSIIYSFLPVALIPYTLGACIWYQRNSVKTPKNPATHLLIASFVVIFCGAVLSKLSVTASFFLSIPIVGYITLVLSKYKLSDRNSSCMFVRFDKFFGHMAYPVYLVHWVGNHLVLSFGYLRGADSSLVVSNANGLYQTTVTGFLFIVVATLLISAVIAVCFEAPIEARRRRWSSFLSAKILRYRTRRIETRSTTVGRKI